MMAERVLLIDPAPQRREDVRRALARAGYRVRTASTSAEAQEHGTGHDAVVLCLPGAWLTRLGAEEVSQHLLGAAHAVPAQRQRVVDLEIDRRLRQVWQRGALLRLEPTSFALLSFLAASPGAVFDRWTIARLVYGYDYLGSGNLIDVGIHRLRHQMGDDPHAPRYIRTVTRVGYGFVEVDDASAAGGAA